MRTETLSGEKIGEIETGASSIMAAYGYGEKVVLVATGWDNTTYKSFYRVFIVDCSVPETPALAVDVKLDVQPYWGGYWFYDVMPLGGAPVPETATSSPGAVAGAEEKQVNRYAMPWYWWPAGDTTFLTGNVLSLRCFAETYDVTFGSQTAQQGLALVDLNTGAWTHTVGLGYEWVDSINAVGSKLYVSTKQGAGSDLIGRGYVAYYISAFDPSVPAMGPLANVPGGFVQYDPNSGVLVLEDVQYDAGVWSVSRTLNSVSWDGGESVTPIDAFPVPDNVNSLKGRGARIYYDVSDQGYVLGAITVSGSGGLAYGDKIKVSDSWAYLVDAHGDSVYLTVGGGAIARYDFSDSPVLADLVPVMNTPQRIRFGASTAYAPLGYAGLVRLPL